MVDSFTTRLSFHRTGATVLTRPPSLPDPVKKGRRGPEVQPDPVKKGAAWDYVQIMDPVKFFLKSTTLVEIQTGSYRVNLKCVASSRPPLINTSPLFLSAEHTWPINAHPSNKQCRLLFFYTCAHLFSHLNYLKFVFNSFRVLDSSWKHGNR